MKRVYFIHPAVKDIESFINYFCLEEMNLEDKIIWDYSAPDLLFVSEHIYLNMKYFKKFKQYLKKSQIVKIFVAGEEVRKAIIEKTGDTFRESDLDVLVSSSSDGYTL